MNPRRQNNLWQPLGSKRKQEKFMIFSWFPRAIPWLSQKINFRFSLPSMQDEILVPSQHKRCQIGRGRLECRRSRRPRLRCPVLYPPRCPPGPPQASGKRTIRSIVFSSAKGWKTNVHHLSLCLCLCLCYHTVIITGASVSVDSMCHALSKYLWFCGSVKHRKWF